MRELSSNFLSDACNAPSLADIEAAFSVAVLDCAAARVNCGAVDVAPTAPWYALSVKHQHERTIEIALNGKGFETFSPTYRVRRQWSDRSKEIELPLFAGYVFCRFPLESKAQVLTTPAVSRVVQFGATIVAVPDAEIEAIRVLVASRLPMRPWPHLKPGDRVRIERGPLRGVVGVLLREVSVKEKDTLELVITVELLQRSVAVRIEAADVVHQPQFRGRCA
jgi:transcription antitermination factor NusG